MGKWPLLQSKLAPRDDDAADGIAVAAHELGERVDHDIGAVIERAADVGRGESVIDHQRDVMLMRDFGHGFDIENVAAGVGDGLAIDAAGAGRDGLAEIFGIVGLDEGGVVAQSAEATRRTGCRCRRRGCWRRRFHRPARAGC